MKPGERIRLSLRLETHPLPGGGLEALREVPPEDWAPFLLAQGHRLEVASGFLLTGKPHTWLLVDGRPTSTWAGTRGKGSLTFVPGRRKGPPGRAWPRMALFDPLPFLRGVGLLSLGLSALGVATGPWPYLPYLGFLALKQGKPWLGLWRRNPLAALEILLFHTFALSLTLGPSPGPGLAYLGVFLFNRLRPLK